MTPLRMVLSSGPCSAIRAKKIRLSGRIPGVSFNLEFQLTVIDPESYLLDLAVFVQGKVTDLAITLTKIIGKRDWTILPLFENDALFAFHVRFLTNPQSALEHIGSDQKLRSNDGVIM